MANQNPTRSSGKINEISREQQLIENIENDDLNQSINQDAKLTRTPLAEPAPGPYLENDLRRRKYQDWREHKKAAQNPANESRTTAANQLNATENPKEKTKKNNQDQKLVNQNIKSTEKSAKKQGGGLQKKDPGVKPALVKSPETASAKKERKTRPNTEGANAEQSLGTILSSKRAGALKQARTASKKIIQGDISGAKEGLQAGAKIGTQSLLTTLWSAVWLDWTLLTLLGLNVYLFASLMLPNYMAQFGEDYVIGKWVPDRELAKILEIILLVIIDFVIIALLAMLIYIIYEISQITLWGWIKIFTQIILGKSPASALFGSISK